MCLEVRSYFGIMTTKKVLCILYPREKPTCYKDGNDRDPTKWLRLKCPGDGEQNALKVCRTIWLLEIQLSVVSVCECCGQRCGWFPLSLNVGGFENRVKIPWHFVASTSQHCVQLKHSRITFTASFLIIVLVNQHYVEKKPMLTLHLTHIGLWVNTDSVFFYQIRLVPCAL